MKHFEELLLSLGAAKCTALLESGNWTLWQAEFRTPVSTVKGNYLYLKSSCPLLEATPKNLSTISAHCGTEGYQVVVTPKSDLARDLKGTVAKFRARDGKTTQELLEDYLLKSIRYKPLQREEHFISPSLVVDGTTSKRDGLTFLTQWLVGDASTAKNTPIGLLCADGGIGKTTLARELCESVRALHPKIVPLLIESDQWKNIANTGFTLDTLWDIAIARRLEHGNLLRSNPAALRVLMQEGLLVVIFDGFDELSAISTDNSRPREIISELRELFTPEDEEVSARVILTSRTTYWNSIADTADIDSAIDIFRLTGFDNEQRKQYFQKRLQDATQRDLSLRLARQISGAIYSAEPKQAGLTEGYNEDRLSGTPFILALIAHFVEGADDASLAPYDADPLEPLILGVCRRENIRQDLKIPPETQISIFEEIFRSSESEFTTDDLDFLLQVYDVDDANVRRRFENHFLLQRPQPNTIVARFEVLKVYFVARFLAKGLQKLYKATHEKEIAQILSNNSTGQSQVSEWLAWQLRGLPIDRLNLAIRHAFEIIEIPINQPSRHRAAIALSHLISQLIPEGDKKARTQSLLKLMVENRSGVISSVRRITFSGRLRAYDFSDTIFETCTFVDVEFNACRFSSATVFRNCGFEGSLEFSSCDDPASIEVVDPRLSPEAELALSTIKSRRPSVAVREAFAEEALGKALRKFRGDSGFHGIQARRRLSGTNSKNPFNTDVWAHLRKHQIVDTHDISGVSDGGLHICDDKDIRREVAQYLDNGIVGVRLRVVLSGMID